MKQFRELRQHILDTWQVDISSKSRKHPTPYLRGGVCYLMSTLYGYPDGMVAKALNCDRTSVLYHRASHEGRYSHITMYADLYDDLYKYILTRPDNIIDIEDIEQTMKEVFHED